MSRNTSKNLGSNKFVKPTQKDTFNFDEISRTFDDYLNSTPNKKTKYRYGDTLNKEDHKFFFGQEPFVFSKEGFDPKQDPFLTEEFILNSENTFNFSDPKYKKQDPNPIKFNFVSGSGYNFDVDKEIAKRETKPKDPKPIVGKNTGKEKGTSTSSKVPVPGTKTPPKTDKPERKVPKQDKKFSPTVKEVNPFELPRDAREVRKKTAPIKKDLKKPTIVDLKSDDFYSPKAPDQADFELKSETQSGSNQSHPTSNTTQTDSEKRLGGSMGKAISLKIPKTIKFPYACTKSEQTYLEEEYPFVKIDFSNPIDNHTHKIAKFEKTLATRTILDGVPRGMSIMDVGGDPNLCISYLKDHPWLVLNPQLGPGDVNRQQNFFDKMSDYKAETRKLIKDKLAVENSTVQNSRQFNRFNTDVAIAIHSIYYLTMDEIGNLVYHTSQQALYAVLHLFPYTSGTISKQLNYVTTEKGEILTFTNSNKDSTYLHPDMDWLHTTNFQKSKDGMFTWVCLKSFGDTHIYKFMPISEQFEEGKILFEQTTTSGLDIYSFMNQLFYVAEKTQRKIRMPLSVVNKYKGKMTGKIRSQDLIRNLTDEVRIELKQLGCTDAKDLHAIVEYVAFSGIKDEISRRERTIKEGDIENLMEDHKKSLQLQSISSNFFYYILSWFILLTVMMLGWTTFRLYNNYPIGYHIIIVDYILSAVLLYPLAQITSIDKWLALELGRQSFYRRY